MYKNKNDYSVVAFNGQYKVNFMRYVHNVYKYTLWLRNNGIEWTHINVYNRRTNEFIKRFYFGNYIKNPH